MSNPKRVFNFNPGPAVLPLEVLEQAQAELLDFKGTGMSVMEISHRSKEFEAVIQTAEADLRELLGIPANYKVMFLQGGASLQFAMIPMNLRAAGASADYIVTGTWSKTAIKEATETRHGTRGCQHREGRFQVPARQPRSRPEGRLPALHLQRNHPRRGIHHGANPARRRAADL